LNYEFNPIQRKNH